MIHTLAVQRDEAGTTPSLSRSRGLGCFFVNSLMMFVSSKNKAFS